MTDPSTVKNLLVFMHKWLGVVLALFFLMWFVSGVVLHYVPFPNLTQAERLAALPPLRLPADCCLGAAEAAQRAGLRATDGEARLGLLGDLPVWRMKARSLQEPTGLAGDLRWYAVDARDGRPIPALSDTQAAAVAEAFSGRRAIGTERLERDQWTVPQGLDPYRPLVKVRLADEDGLELYVSPGAAEVVRDTRRAERFWNWLGAVPHWIYPALLRQFPTAWNQVVVWLSIPGVLVAATGLVLGLWQLFLNRQRWIPYRKFWMRWHHIMGLFAATFTLTWMFSGLMSMNPFGVFTGPAAELDLRAQWAGVASPVQRGPAEAVALAASAGIVPLELDLLRIGGKAWYRVRGQGPGAIQRLVRADGPEATVAFAVPEATMRETLQALRPGSPPPLIEKMGGYDGLYYARGDEASAAFSRPLPVWRAHWSADDITVYADPASARIVMLADAKASWGRLLYDGLHTLDFAPLLARPALRTALLVGLSLLGVFLCITSCVIAWRVFVPAKKKRRQ